MKTGLDFQQEYLGLAFGDAPGEEKYSGAHVKPGRRRSVRRSREKNAVRVGQISDKAIERLERSGWQFGSEEEMHKFIAYDMYNNRRAYGIGFIEAFLIKHVLLWIVTKLVEYFFSEYKA